MKYKVFTVLLCIATLFMGVGYASINSISLNMNGEMTAQVQDGIFITEVKYNDELSNNILVTDSKINSAYLTNLDSSIVLNSAEDSKITYDITIYNSMDYVYSFDKVEYTIGEKTYSNENITFTLTNLTKGDVVNAYDDISFSITFYYKDNSNISDVKLDSILNFKFNVVPIVVGEYFYTGEIKSLSVPYSGTYKLEVWGASGGDCSLTAAADLTRLNMSGGNGGYSFGEVFLDANEEIFIVVGGEGLGTSVAGVSLDGGYNGGGKSIGNSEVNHVYGSGGGATHIAKKTGLLQNLYTEQSSILIVAGGGGGSRNQPNNTSPLARYGNGGAGGGINGIAANGYGGDGTVYINSVIMGTQNGEKEFFGKGEDYIGGGAGGGGFYGGYSGVTRNDVYVGAGDGGSGYIGGVINGNTIAGNLSVPTFDGLSTMIGNDGSGYAKVTFISD